MSSTKLSDIFRNRISGWEEPRFTEETLAKWNMNPKIQAISAGTLAGIEFEIENCGYVEEETTSFQRMFNCLWTITTDGSLRNNGKEFITKPLTGPNLTLALDLLNQTLTNVNKDSEATSRCGIHVHINTLDINTAQLLAWISLYQVFERQLYAVSGSRDKNLFCLPTWAWNGNLMSAIGYLPLGDGGINAIMTLNNQGLKYAGMNTRTLGEHGTLEFRQMQTTKDIPLVAQWVDTLIRIKLYAINSVKDLPELLAFWEKLSELNTTSQYSILLRDVFKDRQEFLMLPNYGAMMAKGIIQVKESIAKYKYTIHKSKNKAKEKSLNERALADVLDRLDRERQAQPRAPAPERAAIPAEFDVNAFRARLQRDNERMAEQQAADRQNQQRIADERARQMINAQLRPAPQPAAQPRRNRPVAG